MILLFYEIFSLSYKAVLLHYGDCGDLEKFKKENRSLPFRKNMANINEIL